MVQFVGKIILSVLADLAAGVVEVATLAGRGMAALARRLFRKRAAAPPKALPSPASLEPVSAMPGALASSQSFEVPVSPTDKASKATFRVRLPRLRLVIIGFAALFFWVVVAGIVLQIRMAALVLPSEVTDLYAANRPPSMTIVDRDGDVIGTRGAILGDRIALEDVPPILIDALIATEDRRYYRHPGFDTRGVLRAIVANVRAGEVVEGGSTITQQLAKNLFLKPDKTLWRKIEEIQLAVWLEAHFTKEEILALYLNRIYMGAGTYGISAAANAYFSKPVGELTNGEAVLLAGLPQAPSSYAPTTNWKAAIKRYQTVLDNLVEDEKLTAEQAQELKDNPPTLDAAETSPANGYFLDHVVAEVTERLGTITEDIIIETTLDSQLQQFAEQAVDEVMKTTDPKTGATQAALIAYDEDGAIVAMVGGLDYRTSQFNRATQAMRQPGSAFKPFVYLAALESGLTPETIVVDRPIKVGKWAPTNYTNRYRGPMRLATALAKSTNTIAVQVTEAIGRDRVIDAARRAGIETDMEQVPSIALGAMEITLEELTAAYLVFSHQGEERPGHAITAVTTRDGRPLGTYNELIDGFQIIEPGLAEETTRMLEQVVKTGTGRKAAIGSWELAGKTGTTNDWRDAWFIGFSSVYTAGVWVGNDKSLPMDEITGGTLPLQIWRRFMVLAHGDQRPGPLLADSHTTLEDVSRLAGYYGRLRSDLIDTVYGTPEPLELPWWRKRKNTRTGPPPTSVVGQAAPGVADHSDDPSSN